MQVARASGVRSVVEQTELKKKIAELTTQLERQNGTLNMLNQQCKRLVNDLKRAKRRAEELDHESKRLTSGLAELEMNNTSAQRQLKKLVTKKEESMVGVDVLKLEVKRLRELLNAKADEVFGLQNRKYQLQLSMDERQQEIKVHSDVLKAQLKAAEDERHMAAKELSDRLLKVERLNGKYEVICGKMGSTGEEEGEHSQAYYVIKAAQEREELQRQGDELDQQIQKAEREVRALEKTLGHLFEKNAGYKQSFAPVSSKTPQFEQKVLLEEQHRAALSKYRSQRLQQSELEEEMQRMDAALGELDEDKTVAQHQLMGLSEQSGELHDALQGQLGELDQVRAQVQGLLADHRRRAEAAGFEGRTLLELEAEVGEQRAANKAVVRGLSQLCAEEPEVGAYLEQMGFQAFAPDDPALDDDDDDDGDIGMGGGVFA